MTHSIFKTGQVFGNTEDANYNYEFELKKVFGKSPTTMLSGELTKKTKTGVAVSSGFAILDFSDLDAWELLKTY